MWIRDIQVLAGNLSFTNLGDNRLEIEFDIPFSDKKEPDISEVTIYNLSNSTLSKIKNDGYIYVNAGYKNLGNKGNILTGEIEDIITTYQGVDKITKITISDGAKSFRTVQISKSYAPNTKASYILKELGNILGYEISTVEPVNDIVYKRGKVLNGKAADILIQIVNETNSKMFVNKNRLVIRANNVGNDTGFILNANSGLIGTPTMEIEDKEDNGKNIRTIRWRVVSLLNPLLETDSIIQVESKTIKGNFRIKEGRHNKDFNTEMLVESI